MRHLLCIFISLVFNNIAHAQVAENVTLLCNWNETAGIRPHNAQYFNDVWGFVHNGKEYAAIGSSEGVHIIDVDNCNQVAFHQAPFAGPDVIHRDYKVYRNYLYAVCDEGEDSRLEVFDLSYLPDSLHLVYVSTEYECVTTHNLFVDSAKAKLYFGIHKAKDQSGGLVDNRMACFSLANPEHPTFLAAIGYNDFPQPIHDMYVRNDTAYCSASNSGFLVADFSANTSYQVLGVLPDYDYKGYNHSSWINSSGIGVMADETHGMPVKVIDARTINNIEVIGAFMPSFTGDTVCVPHNPFILNEDYVLVSYYMDGLQIYNISQPDSPYRVGYYDTYPAPSFRGFAGAWGCYPYLPSHRILVSDMQTGLYVFNADSALNLSVKDTLITKRPFNIYPNPATDKLTISLPETGDISLSVCDIQGRVILKQAISLGSVPNQGIELPLPRNCPMGMYILHIIAGSSTYTGKFIKAQN